MSEGRRNVLEQWVGKYVELLVEVNVKDAARQRTGRIEAVGRDGIIFQPVTSRQQTQDLPSPNFFPWQQVLWVDLIDE